MRDARVRIATHLRDKEDEEYGIVDPLLGLEPLARVRRLGVTAIPWLRRRRRVGRLRVVWGGSRIWRSVDRLIAIGRRAGLPVGHSDRCLTPSKVVSEVAGLEMLSGLEKA